MESRVCPMSTCAAPTGSPCRTGKGKVAVQYPTARFRLVPQLAKALNVPIPALRKPGPVWTELPRPASAGDEPVGHVRLGYARTPTARQSLDAQLDSLAEDLKAGSVDLEFLTGELKGSHDPSDIVFTVLSAMSGMEREYIRDRTLEGHESARKRGKTIGGAGVWLLCGWCLS
ncbi:recombinase family protein [Streptomyces diastatochromogenes]|nr:recombinase family protein [Streptomyces diastatochromogenes]